MDYLFNPEEIQDIMKQDPNVELVIILVVNYDNYEVVIFKRV